MAAQPARENSNVKSLPVPPTVPATGLKPRHRRLLASFVLVVLMPVGATAAYLWTRAADQFESTLAFSVRQEEAPAPSALFGAFAGFASQTASDTDVLYAYLDSADLVARVDADLGLRAIYSLPRAQDPVFAFDRSGTIEDLTGYWRRMTRVAYDPGTGLIEIRVRAFDAASARAIAEAVLEASTALVNGLSETAREDAMRYAEADLVDAVAALGEARGRLTAFRTTTQIVDPGADLQGRMGLIAELQTRLADELIRVDLLELRTGPDDPRLNEGRQVTRAIEARIAAERRRLGAGGQEIDERDYAGTLQEFSRLSVDVEIAEEAYASARAARDLARAEARRQSRYLAAHVRPTLAERSTAPNRPLILAVSGFFLFLAWALAALIFYSLRDRRRA